MQQTGQNFRLLISFGETSTPDQQAQIMNGARQAMQQAGSQVTGSEHLVNVGMRIFRGQTNNPSALQTFAGTTNQQTGVQNCEVDVLKPK